MRALRFLSVLGVAFFLALSSSNAQNGPFQRLFSGEKAAKSTMGGAGKDSAAKLSLFGGPKRVEIDLTAQRLRAYEGNRLVMQTRISSGRNRATPTGRFTAGPYKAEKHYSSLYQNAPMPWSVQVHGHIFIHGFSSVPDYPASHGCIRVPVTGNNPAKRFYNWVEVGTPIHIFY
ncbi:MAG: L,D-transpeptidase [Verrucomicrobiae bacterium]|nr:L,D-transpeptidase [Verrucomicrobiae bacterium]